MKHQAQNLMILIVCTGLAVLPACAPKGPAAGDQAVAQLGTAVAQTATAAGMESGEINELATAEANATEKARDVQATQTARAVGQSDSQIAEATLAAPMVAELPQYGLDKTSGRPAWLHDPLVLEISGYQQMTYGNDHPEVTAADFVLAADLTWDTQYGSSGCGFMFRSDGNQDKPNMYMVLATRFASGHVLFSALADGEIANVHDFYPKTSDQSFQWQNGTTNRLAVVARGTLIEIYTNGVKIGEVDTTKPPTRLPSPPKPIPPVDQTNAAALQAYQNQMKEYQEIIEQQEAMFRSAQKKYNERIAIFDEGFLAFVAASESGRTVCTFEDAWLWLLEP